ncbi:uncharacterized protein LOC143366504 [Andrena cerasifolii]|uniref:uncharacterized protein LOC143366504 n=1 Tax=Andrena cerasifolii TaxID=2819439 RepID=UPI00403828FA
MQDLCPLCLKKGVKKKVKLLQINLQEALWVCEEEKCTWPFGYEDFIFCPRVVGKIWSCYWDDYKTTPKFKETVVAPTKPALRDAPITAPIDAPTECTTGSSLDANRLESINGVRNSSKAVEAKDCISDLHTFIHEELDTLLLRNDKDQFTVINDSLSKNFNSPNLSNSTLQLNDQDAKITKIKDERVDVLKKHVKEGFCTQSIQNMNNARGIPKITSIEKTNIDISNVIIANQASIHQNLEKKTVTNYKPTDETGDKLPLPTDSKLLPNYLSESENLASSEPRESSKLNNESAGTKSNLSVTKMKIDGLPPITLSFEIPVCATIPETVTSGMKQSNCQNGTPKSNTPEVKCTSVKRAVNSGKHYAKFSFSAIKKKLEPNNSINTNGNDISSLKSSSKMQDVENNSTSNIKNESSTENACKEQKVVNGENGCKEMVSVTNVTSDHASTQINDSVTTNSLPNQENTTPDTSILDTVLEDFLSNDYSVSEDINDEWLNSLLT